MLMLRPQDNEAISMFCYISLVCAKTTLEEGDVGLAL